MMLESISECARATCCVLGAERLQRALRRMTKTMRKIEMESPLVKWAGMQTSSRPDRALRTLKIAHSKRVLLDKYGLY